MIEMYSVTHSGAFATNTETSRRQENPETGFDKLFRDAAPGENDSGAAKVKQTEDSTDPPVAVSRKEMVTYSYWGRKTVDFGTSGRVFTIEA